MAGGVVTEMKGSVAEGTLTRPAADLSLREQCKDDISFKNAPARAISSFVFFVPSW